MTAQDPDDGENIQPEHDEIEPESNESAAAGLGRSGLVGSVARAASGETLTREAVIESIGGVRGVLESVVPGVVFLGAYIFTRDLVPSVIAPVVIGVLFLVARLVQKQPVMPALSGLFGILFCVVIALLTGQARDYYVTGFFTNIAWGLGLLISVIVGWPIVGVGIGFFTGIGTSWRRDKKTFRVMMLVTLMWVGLFTLRLVVQLPLYYANQIEALGVARFVMGIPFFALLIVVSWLLVRSSIGRNKAEHESARDADSGGGSDETPNLSV